MAEWFTKSPEAILDRGAARQGGGQDARRQRARLASLLML